MAERPQYDPQFLKAWSTVPERDLVVMNNVNCFPIYHEDFTLPYATIAYIYGGFARVRYDNRDFTLHPNSVAILGRKHILHAIDNSPDLNVTLVFLSEELVVETRVSAFRYDHQKYHNKPLSTHTPEQMNTIREIAHLLETIASPDLLITHRRKSLVGLLNISSELLTTYRLEQDKLNPPSHASQMFAEFMDLLADNYTEHHDVQFYASALNMTPKYLSKIIHDATGKGAFAWISEYIINRSIILLENRPDLTIQRIGELVGFKEQPSFTRFFKRYAKVSPRDFREHRH